MWRKTEKPKQNFSRTTPERRLVLDQLRYSQHLKDRQQGRIGEGGEVHQPGHVTAEDDAKASVAVRFPLPCSWLSGKPHLDEESLS